ncbi:unnamed protein product [Aphanomyces euteiches]
MRGHAAPVLLIAAQLIEGFRIVNVTDKSQLTQVPPAVFGPYAKGFVGYYGDPDATFFREHINSGAIFNPEVPAQWNDITISRTHLSATLQSAALVWLGPSVMENTIAWEKSMGSAINAQAHAGATRDTKA